MDRLLKPALEALGPLLTQICNITGTPGISLGVLHHGEILHTASYGFQDVENRVTPNADTSFLLCSITKAITASMIGMMVDEGKLDFTTQLRQIFPEYQRDDAQANITIEDLLSHRTGLAPYDSLWLSSDNRIFLNRSDAIPVLSYVPSASPLRTRFVYDNIGYEILGQVLEKLTGLSYLELLHERIIRPLHLNRTFFAEEPFDDNTAKSYAALGDGSFYSIPPWGHGKDMLIGAAGAIRSSVSDLLVLYKALIDAANSQISTLGAENPFKQMPMLLQGKIGVPNQSLREYSYASGWIRAELPAILDLFADYEPPILSNGSASRLMIYHQGYIPGNAAFVALFPETTTAVVVLGNSAGLTDAMKLLGQIVVETVLGNKVDAPTYVEAAKAASKNNVLWPNYVHQELLDGKTHNSPKRSTSAYTGRYYNAIENFFIDINEVEGKFQVSYMGSNRDTFDLEPYQTDSFFWWIDYDETVKRARLSGFPKEYFILSFGCPSKPTRWVDVRMDCLGNMNFNCLGTGRYSKGREASCLVICSVSQRRRWS
jgi:CubicO group peptidase (beta-lactamase class C family)